MQQVSNQPIYVIQPANPQVVYVPQYNPTVVYTAPSAGAVVATSLITFGIGIRDRSFSSASNQPWGWGGWGWGWGGRGVYYNHGPWGGWHGGYRPPSYWYRPRPVHYVGRPGYGGNWGYRPPNYRPPYPGNRPAYNRPGTHPAVIDHLLMGTDRRAPQPVRPGGPNTRPPSTRPPKRYSPYARTAQYSTGSTCTGVVRRSADTSGTHVKAVTADPSCKSESSNKPRADPRPKQGPTNPGAHRGGQGQPRGGGQPQPRLGTCRSWRKRSTSKTAGCCHCIRHAISACRRIQCCCSVIAKSAPNPIRSKERSSFCLLL